MSLSAPASLPAEPRPGRYRHYKGKDYQVIALARHSETEEVLVVYKLLYGDFSTWVRPHAMFTSTVNLPDGTVTPRFAYVGAT
jgi:hypothetical protein